MRFQYASDLHLEFPDNRAFLEENPLQPVAPVLILAGDIVCDANREEAASFFARIRRDFDLIIEIPGNHEFYNGSVDQVYPRYHKWIADNHLYLNNSSTEVDGVHILATTLWSHVLPEERELIERRLNDYHLIAREGEPLNADDTNLLHESSVRFLQRSLAESDPAKTLVVTHHLPSKRCVDPKWTDSPLLHAFVAELDELIEKFQPAAWIFGHQHESVQTDIEATHMLSNPLGYMHEEQHRRFNRALFLEIP